LSPCHINLTWKKKEGSVSRRSSIAERLTDNTVASYCASFAVDLVKGKKVAACAAVSVFAVKHKHAYGYFVTLLPCGRHDERLPDAELLRRKHLLTF